MVERIDAERIVFETPDRSIVPELSFSIEPHESVVLRGPSNSGLSTLLEICAGLRSPHTGTVRWEGRELGHWRRSELAAARARTGFVFPSGSLISNMNVFDNIALPLRYHGYPEQQCRKRVTKVCEELRLERYCSLLPENLSRSHQRRVSLARAAVVEPSMLFIDDPAAGLDPDSCILLLDFIVRLKKTTGCTLLGAAVSDSLQRALGARTISIGATMESQVPPVLSGRDGSRRRNEPGNTE
jgi:ABC-type transporter Mla maintaining outer membrane lipid asymmetry ATPase subunit MlaF